MINTKFYNLDLDDTLGGSNASDYTVSSQKAIKTYIDNSLTGMSYVTTNYSALVPSEGICTWEITHNLNTTNVSCSLYVQSTQLVANVTIDSADAITISFTAADTVAAGTCTAVIFASGGIAGASVTTLAVISDTDNTLILNTTAVDSSLSTTSQNAIENAVVTTALEGKLDSADYVVDSALSSNSENPVQNKVINTALGNKLDSADYVVDSTLSASSTNPVQNKVIYPALSGFIPKDTIFTIKADGSGDFTKLSDALSYISDKWSDGKVIIHLGTGIFTEVAINLDLQDCNISTIQIEGEGTSNTTLSLTDTTEHTPKVYVYGKCIEVKFIGINFSHPSGSKSTDYRGIDVAQGVFGYVQNCSFSGLNYAVQPVASGVIQLSGTNTFSNCQNAIVASGGGRIVGSWGITITVNNCTNAFYVEGGGMISIPYPTYTGTNVTNKFSQKVNTITANGIITGFTS